MVELFLTQSPCASPYVAVSKSKGTLRLCQGNQKVNDETDSEYFHFQG